MARPITLAELKRRHDNATGRDAYKVRALARNQARSVAKRLGVDAPAWAARLAPARRKAAQRVGRAWMVKPAAAATRKGGTAPVSADALAALRAWRERTPGAVVQVSRRGVALHTLGGVRRFRDVAAALASL